ncbi:metallophosphoesterase [Mesorhizobium sp.]|uniref:metallophosphoesterase n=1 Tax=Mesorhizobium sp. TaxID=1871066 RepID=UPI00345B796B
MKVIQVTDVHLGRLREIRYGANLNERLDRCIDHINQRHSDGALCIFTGDLTDDGEADSYADLKAALSRLAVPYRLLPGNHDRRANLIAAFPENGTDGNGFVQSVFDTPEGRLIFLDSLAEGRVTGELCDDRLGWLDAGSPRWRGRRPISSCTIRRSSSGLRCSTRSGSSSRSGSSTC